MHQFCTLSSILPERRPPGEVEAGLVVGTEAPHDPGEAGHHRGVVLADVGEAPGRQLPRVVHLGGLQELHLGPELLPDPLHLVPVVDLLQQHPLFGHADVSAPRHQRPLGAARDMGPRRADRSARAALAHVPLALLEKGRARSRRRR